MYKTILVPVDGSANSRRAIEAAAELAKCHQASIVLLHVILDEPLPKELLRMIVRGEITESRMEILRDSAEIILQDAQEKLHEAGVTEDKCEYIMGDPAFKILEYAENIGADLIVIGHRGLGTQVSLLGSVARKLVNITRVACLIVV
jgi:nucleotide-binding universal stress UspA family protein